MGKKFLLLFAVLIIPFLLTSIFGVKLADETKPLDFNDSTPYRGDHVFAYVNWNETVNSSFISLNMTHSDTTVLKNYTCVTGFVCNATHNNTWTNYTIVTNASWSVGNHTIKIYVNNTISGSVENVTEANLTIYGKINTTFNAPSANTIYYRGDSIVFNVTVRDQDNSSAMTGINVTFYNDTGIVGSNVSDTDGISYITYDLSTSATLGLVNYTANVTDTTQYYRSGVNDSVSIYHYGWSNLSSCSADYSADPNETITWKCRVLDANTSSGIENYPVKFYTNDTGSFYLNATNFTVSGWAYYYFNESQEMVIQLKANITDNSTLYYKSSSVYENTTNMIVDIIGVRSPLKKFSSTPSQVSFNWTSDNITLKSYLNSIQLNIDNVSTTIEDNYTQQGEYSGFTIEICWNPGLTFIVNNQTNDGTNFTQTLNFGEREWFTLDPPLSCPPGKYIGNFTVKQVDNSSETTSIHAIVDIPIHTQNTLNSTSREGYFRGRMPVNASTYHSLYFNTSTLENTTGVTITLSNYVADIDLFLLDGSGNLKKKSINKDSSNEKIRFVRLPSSSEFWEIRIYGSNTTSSESYRGNLYFTTLNCSNASINFGQFNVSENATKTFTLENEGNTNLTNVNQYLELYHVQALAIGNTSKDFKFLVPKFVEKIKVSVNWSLETGKNVTDWDIFLSKPDNTTVGNSTSKYLIANTTNVAREEFIVYSSSISEDEEGYWNISVRNQTKPPLNFYNVTVYLWLNESKWIQTNYTDGFDFSSTGSANSTYLVQLNLSVPTQVLNGNYEGSFIYNSSDSGWNFEIPFTMTVNTSTLIINNELNTSTYRITDNIGFDRVRVMNITFNNTGSYPINYINSTSNYTLTLDSNSNISFTVDDWPPNPINPGISGTINITVSINTTLTGNDDGIYKGWIFFNTTNTTTPSYPYTTFNLTLEVNLTDRLRVSVIGINTTSGNDWKENSTTDESMTYITQVFLINGTQITDPDGSGGIKTLYISNFTAAWMNETNVTTYNTELTNITQKTDTNPDNLCIGSYCYVNATISKNLAGGRYEMSIKVRWNTSKAILEGIGSYKSLVYNNTGLHMSTNASSCSFGTTTCNPSFSMSNASTYKFFVNVSNYGPLAASSATIHFSESCGLSVGSAGGSAGCSISGTPSSTITISPSGYSSTCLVWWTITAGSGAESCTANIIGGSTWFNPRGINATITVTATTTSTTTTTASSEEDEGGGDSETTTTTTSTTTTTTIPYLDITSYPTEVSVEQGKNKTETVTVENKNDTVTQNVTLTILDIISSWFEIDTSEVEIEPEESHDYSVSFMIPDNATVKDYSGKFNASSSYGSVTKDFTLKVTPGEELQQEIVANLSTYESEMKSLGKQINQSKDQGYNISEAEDIFSQLKTKIDQALDYVNASDYRSAYDLFPEIDNLFNQTKTALSEAGVVIGESWWGWGKWVVTAVVGVVVALLGYMLWPTSTGYEPGKGYVHKEEEKKEKVSLLKKIKEKLKR